MSAEAAQEIPKTQARPAAHRNDGDIFLAERYQIFPESPLPSFDQPGGHAFMAQDKRLTMRPLVARICDQNVLPRIDTLVQLKRQTDIQVMQPLAWGPVYWAPEKRDAFVIVFDRPETGPLMPSLKAKIPNMSAEAITRDMIAPITLALALFVRHGQTHRGIRPTNMFMESQDVGRVILGDCVSTPPGFGQPVAVEPIEMAMTPPLCRGRGSVADDIYSFGASLLFVALGFCPVAGMSDAEIIQAKVSSGSFAALLHGHSPPTGLREPIRGMLVDNPSDRWKIEDIERWLSGDIRRSVQPIRELSADRVFEFAGREFHECRALAHAFGEKWQIAGRVARSHELENWIYRGVADPRLTDAMKEVMFLTRRSAEHAGEGRLVSQVCMALDPWGPVRYNGFKAMPDGLGWALSEAFMAGREDVIQLVAEIVGKGLLFDWFRYRAAQTKEDFTFSVRSFKRLQQLLKAVGPGYGVERCLYELSPLSPCLSDALRGVYVYAIQDLLPALEKTVDTTGRLPRLLDRHIAAFVAARIGGKVDNQLAMLESAQGDTLKAKLGMVSMFAKLQHEFGPEHLPKLTVWLAREVEPAVKRFHSRSLREQMQKLLESVAVRGSIIELDKAVNSENLVKRDSQRREAATRDYARAESAIDKLESRAYQEMAQHTGWSIATGISAFIAFVTITTLILL